MSMIIPLLSHHVKALGASPTVAGIVGNRELHTVVAEEELALRVIYCKKWCTCQALKHLTVKKLCACQRQEANNLELIKSLSVWDVRRTHICLAITQHHVLS